MANLGQLKSNLDHVIQRWYDDLKDDDGIINPTLHLDLLKTLKIKPYLDATNEDIGFDIDNNDNLKMEFTSANGFTWTDETDDANQAADTGAKLAIPHHGDLANTSKIIYNNDKMKGSINGDLPLSGFKFKVHTSDTSKDDFEVILFATFDTQAGTTDTGFLSSATGNNGGQGVQPMFGLQFKAGKVKKWVYDSTGTGTSFTHTNPTDTNTYGSWYKIGLGSGTTYADTDTFSIIIDNTFTEFDKTGGTDNANYDSNDLITSSSITKIVYLKNNVKIDEEYVLTDTTKSTFGDYRKLSDLEIGVKTGSSAHTNGDTELDNFSYVLGSDVSLNYNSYSNLEPAL